MRTASLLPLVLLATALTGCAGLEEVAPSSASWPGCKGFQSQEQAQARWESDGKPSSVRGSSDGRVCESLPSRESSIRGAADSSRADASGAKTSGCRRQRQPVVVRISRSKSPETTLNYEDARRHGLPAVQHIDRVHDDANRDAWEALVPKSLDTDGDGQVEDRDEHPGASTTEGGLRTKAGASRSQVAFVDPADNRSAGAVLGGKLRPYCDGQAFTIRPYGQRRGRTTITVAARGGRRVNDVITATR